MHFKLLFHIFIFSLNFSLLLFFFFCLSFCKWCTISLTIHWICYVDGDPARVPVYHNSCKACFLHFYFDYFIQLSNRSGSRTFSKVWVPCCCFVLGFSKPRIVAKFRAAFHNWYVTRHWEQALENPIPLIAIKMKETKYKALSEYKRQKVQNWNFQWQSERTHLNSQETIDSCRHFFDFFVIVKLLITTNFSNLFV